jgi:hypothetical protein
MADNTTLNPGVGGDTMASNDIGGVKHQRVKVEYGPPGSATDVADADGARLPVKPPTASVGTRSQVPDNASEVQVLAANANRKCAVITNDSSGVLAIGLGATPVTSTNYTKKIYQDGEYEVPACFTGEIRGLWLTDPNDGGARVTELT